MAETDPRCVYETSDPHLADVIVGALASEGIDAHVLDRRTEGNLFGASLKSGAAGNGGGVDVWVKDAAQRETALQVIEAHRQHPKSASPVRVLCAECEREADFPGSQRGTVQECPFCGAYLDIPDESGDSDFDLVDETETPDLNAPSAEEHDAADE